MLNREPVHVRNIINHRQEPEQQVHNHVLREVQQYVHNHVHPEVQLIADQVLQHVVQVVTPDPHKVVHVVTVLRQEHRQEVILLRQEVVQVIEAAVLQEAVAL